MRGSEWVVLLLQGMLGGLGGADEAGVQHLAQVAAGELDAVVEQEVSGTRNGGVLCAVEGTEAESQQHLVQVAAGQGKYKAAAVRQRVGCLLHACDMG